MKYEVVQSPEVHEPMGRDYAGTPIYSLAFSVDLKTFDRLVIIAGQVPLDKQGKVVSDVFADQFHQVFRKPEGHRGGCGREDGEHHLPADPVEPRGRSADLPSPARRILPAAL